MMDYIKLIGFLIFFVAIWAFIMISAIDKQYEGLETVCVEFKYVLIMKDGEPTKTGYAACTQQVVVRK